jgi:hypothetical protein
VVPNPSAMWAGCLRSQEPLAGKEEHLLIGQWLLREHMRCLSRLLGVPVRWLSSRETHAMTLCHSVLTGRDYQK